MYEYTLAINSEMSVSVSAFPGMLNVAHLKQNMLSSTKLVLIDMYTEILRIYPCMYLSIEDEMLKIYLSICTNMKLFSISKLFY
jgi:hypothetical protein